MKIAVIYASTEGQTRKIALRAMSTLQHEDHSVALIHANDAGALELSEFEAALLAGSVHLGKHQPELVDFAKDHASALNAMPTMFLSVSLAAASDDETDLADLGTYGDRFVSETGWKPGRIKYVAGAFKFTEYDFFKYWAMRWIKARNDPSTSSDESYEYTDWDDLDEALRDWMHDAATAG